MTADGFRVGAEREGEFYLVGDDVGFGAAVDGADGDDGGIERARLAADDRLERGDDAGGEDDRVFGGVRVSAVAAGAAHGDFGGVDVGPVETLEDADGASGQRRAVVDGEGEVGLGKFLIEAFLEHGAGADAAFLGGLADEEDGARPTVAVGGELASGAGEDRHVQIVTAGLHDGDVFAREIGDARGAGVGDAGFFQDGQAVEIRANKQRGAGAVFEDADDAVTAKFFRDFETDSAEFGGEFGGGFFLHERELGVGVEVGVEGEERRIIGGEFLRDDDGRGAIGGTERRSERNEQREGVEGKEFHLGSSRVMRASRRASVWSLRC